MSYQGNARFVDGLKHVDKDNGICVKVLDEFEGRQVVHTEFFEWHGEDWECYHRASARLKEMGYESGSPERGAPIGFANGDVTTYISKWSKMMPGDVERLDGVIRLIGDLRNGPMQLLWWTCPTIPPSPEFEPLENL